MPLPEKDFKAVISDGYVKKVGVEYFDDAMEAQALYKLNKKEWNKYTAFQIGLLLIFLSLLILTTYHVVILYL